MAESAFFSNGYSVPFLVMTGVGLALAFLLLGLIALPLLLAAMTRVRHVMTTDITTKGNWTSALYQGRVWHTRHIPTKHAFTYPLFLFAIDLEEVPCLFSVPRPWLWPLNWIISFRESDHLKNGEGLEQQQSDNENQHDNRLVDRVLRLVAKKTNDKFQPTLQTHRVLLITHLSYYGYCFNPVSFYFVQQRNATNNYLDAVVAEVSNTPWNEMHCYVLHPDSTKYDQVQVKTVSPQSEDNDNEQVITYVFPKRFHVSPFMEMEYSYDWTFANFDPDCSSPLLPKIRITTAMKRGDQLHFSATMKVTRQSSPGMHPMTLAWQIATYPLYCMIIQLWIHYEAFWLFVKGVPFVPHPDDAETAASRFIGAIMTPLFALQAWWELKWSSGSNGSSSASTATTCGKKAN